MPKNRKDYPVIDSLPENAMTVATYAKHQACTTPYIYEMYRKNKGDFYIAIFQGINFVIPLTNN